MESALERTETWTFRCCVEFKMENIPCRKNLHLETACDFKVPAKDKILALTLSIRLNTVNCKNYEC